VKGEALKGHLDLLLLAVLDDGPLHGYAVIDRLRIRSAEVFDLPEGTVYPALHRLEEERLLTSSWSQEQGRRRRTYRLTAKGQRALRERSSSWVVFADAVGRVVGGAPWPATS
jgi:DNA-binding PadR family transcriptional regulator